MFGKRRSLAGKRIIISGASSGIGEALARVAGRRGAKLILAARSQERLERLAAELSAAGAEAHAVPTDVTNPEDRRNLFAVAAAHFGGVDILVNNAGVGAFGHFIDLGPEILRRIMEVNFFAAAECCRLAIPLLAEGNQPLIVNVSSMTGRRGVPAWTEYSASKFALAGFSEALRAELARFDIDLLLVVPGLTRSDLGRHLLADRGRMPPSFANGLPPAQVAEAIVRGIERNKREIRTERQARLMLFVNWLAPRYVDWRLARIVRRLYADEIAARKAKAVAPDAVHV